MNLIELTLKNEDIVFINPDFIQYITVSDGQVLIMMQRLLPVQGTLQQILDQIYGEEIK